MWKSAVADYAGLVVTLLKSGHCREGEAEPGSFDPLKAKQMLA